MAVVHISRTEAANDFDALIARAGQGDEIVIGDAPAVVLKRALQEPGRYLSEMVASAERRGSTATLDEGFARDLEAVINSHPEAITDPWD